MAYGGGCVISCGTFLTAPAFTIQHSESGGSDRGAGGGQLGPGPPQYNQNKCIFNKPTIKVYKSCSCRCPGTSSLLHAGATPTMSFYLCNSRSNVCVVSRLRAMNDAESAQKALQGSDTKTRDFLGGTEEKRVSPMRGSIFYPSGPPNI